MNRGTAMLLAPHASGLHPLMAAGPRHLIVIAPLAIVFLLWWIVAATSPGRSR